MERRGSADRGRELGWDSRHFTPVKCENSARSTPQDCQGDGQRSHGHRAMGPREAEQLDFLGNDTTQNLSLLGGGIVQQKPLPARSAFAWKSCIIKLVYGNVYITPQVLGAVKPPTSALSGADVTQAGADAEDEPDVSNQG